MAADGSLNTAIRRVPTVLQLESVECGAAALAMVLAHHGRWVPLEVLRVACGVSRDGSKAGNILRAARTFGLVARGFKKEPKELGELPLPSILFWNFNHFVVLEGFEDGEAWISDPALGRRKVGSEEFDSAFTGVVLTFERGPDFQPGGDKPSIVRSLAQYLAGMHPAIAFAIVLGVLLVPPGLLLPWFMGRFVDEVLVGKMGGVAGPLLLGLALAALARSALLWIQAHVLMDTYGRAAAQASRRFVGHALSLPMEFFVQRSPGEIASRVDLNERVAETISNDLAHLALSLLTASFYLILMVQLEAGLAVIVVACLALELLVWRVLAERTAEISRQLSVRAGKLAGAAAGALANIEVIKAAGLEPLLFARWMGLQVQLSNATVQAQRLSLTLGQVPGLLSLVAYLAVLGLGSLRIVEGTFTVGNLVAFQVLLAGFIAPVHALFTATQHMQTLTGDLARLDDVLHYKGDAKVTMTPPPKDEVPLAQASTLEFRGVTFGYNRGEPPLVHDFHLTLKPGQRVALVGASGCGKSTLGRLAVGLYAPWQGEVLFDGKPRSEWDRVALARSVAYVDQDVVLFQGSVRDNLSLWDPRIGEDAIREALRDAALEGEILGRTGALEAPLQEGARNLSGGQRQRLEIARALAASPSILILDEATSALDPLTEATVDASLRRRGIACLVIAHRLSTVRGADEIIVLDTGRVVERGRHEELVRIPGGRYAALVAMDALS